MYFFPGVKKSPPPHTFPGVTSPIQQPRALRGSKPLSCSYGGKKTPRKGIYTDVYIYIYTPSFTIHGESEYTRSRIFKISSRLKKKYIHKYHIHIYYVSPTQISGFSD